jgi:hypothetical protein
MRGIWRFGREWEFLADREGTLAAGWEYALDYKSVDVNVVLTESSSTAAAAKCTC